MDGANASDIEIKDSLVFISTGTDIEKRNIYSGLWQQVLEAHGIFSLTNAGNYLFGRNWYYLYRTDNNGQSWDTITFMVDDFAIVDTMLFMTNIDDIKRSDNYANSWYSVKNNITTTGLCNLFANGTTLIAVYKEALKIYFSENGGLHWDSLSVSGLGTNLWYVNDIYKYQSVFWLSSTSGIYKYNGTQQSWFKMNDTLSFNTFGEYQGVLYGCGNGFFQLGPNWNTWIARNDGLDASTVYAMCSKDTLLFCGTEQGPYKTATSLQWQPWYQNLHGGEVYSISCNGDEAWVCSSLGVHKSTVNGSSFVKKTYSDTKGFKKMIITDSLYFAINNKGFCISYDHGGSWVKEMNGLPAGSSVLDFTLGDEYIFLLYGTYSGDLYRSHYLPVHWEIIPASPNEFNQPVAAHGSTFIVNGNYDPWPYITAKISHNNGAFIDSLMLSQGWVFPFIKFDHGKFFICEGKPIYSSDDDGFSWNQIPMAIQEYHGTSCSENDYALVAVGWMYEFYGVAYITYDQGSHWTDIADNLLYQTPGFREVRINQNRILLGTSSIGLWYRDDLLTGIKPITGKKDNFLRIYPNPAYDKLIVSFDLPENSEGKIVIYDQLGTTLYNGEKKLYRKGYCKEIIDVSRLADGFFIVSIMINGRSYNQKFCHTTK